VGALTIGRVHLRRARLLFALVLGLTALATAIAPPPPEPRDEPTAAPPPTRTVPEPTEITFVAPPRGKALRQKVDADAHVVIEVLSLEGGQVTIPKLGRLATVAEGSPARFDLLGLAPGRYDVLFEPALASRPVRVGTIVSSR
jgi:hypothetical protein